MRNNKKERGEKVKTSKRIRIAAGKVMSSEDGYEVRDAIASALVDVADAMKDYEEPKLMMQRIMRRNCIKYVLISSVISSTVASMLVYLLQ